jgi:hypothetical protein
VSRLKLLQRDAACCARAVSGQVPAAQPMSVMNSRLFTRSPRRRG